MLLSKVFQGGLKLPAKLIEFYGIINSSCFCGLEKAFEMILETEDGISVGPEAFEDPHFFAEDRDRKFSRYFFSMRIN